MTRGRAALRLAGGAVILLVLLWRFGTGPFADAWRVTTWWSVLSALVLTGLATLAAAWRWRVVARVLGAPLTVGGSLAAYYRSQFLNATLPLGVLGDAHRGVRHGRDAGDLGVGLRATAWDRVCGQLVQVGLLAAALVVLDSPLRRYAPAVLAGLTVVTAVALWLARARRRSGAAGLVGDDLRVLAGPPVSARIAMASFVATAAHVGVFAVALLTAGVRVPPALGVSIALTVLVGSAVPLSVAGWGPREGVTAGVFALVGLGSSTGLTVSVVFGVLAAVATVPGLAVLAADAVVRRRAPAAALPAHALQGAGRG